MINIDDAVAAVAAVANLNISARYPPIYMRRSFCWFFYINFDVADVADVAASWRRSHTRGEFTIAFIQQVPGMPWRRRRAPDASQITRACVAERPRRESIRGIDADTWSPNCGFVDAWSVCCVDWSTDSADRVREEHYSWPVCAVWCVSRFPGA